jgi:hypothetical protein
MTKVVLPQGRKPLTNEWFANKLQDFSSVTKLEIVSNKHGCIFTSSDINSVEVQLQDGASTLKIFISEED